MVSAIVALGGLGLIAVYLCVTVDKPETDKNLLELHNLQTKERLSNYQKDRTYAKHIVQETTAKIDGLQMDNCNLNGKQVQITIDEKSNNSSGKYKFLATNKGKEEDTKETRELK